MKSAIIDTKTILIADDNKMFVESLKQLCDFYPDLKCVVFSNGKEVLNNIHSVMPDFVILDVMMPEMNGIEVCKFIKKDAKLKKTFVLMLSALGEAKDKKAGKFAGCDKYMVKPFGPRDVINVIRENIDKSK
jgi:DNA-binding response OmpR family regulator